MALLTIDGRVIDRSTTDGIPHLRVQAWTERAQRPVSTTETSGDGAFRMLIEDSALAEVAGRNATLFFRVFRGEQLLRDTNGAVTWTSRTRAPIVIDVKIATVPILPPEAECVVRGQVTEQGRPVSGVIVRVYDQDIERLQRLGDPAHEVVTDEQGHYQITYTAEQFVADETYTADLVVRVFDRENVTLGEAGPRYKAGRDETIDFEIVRPPKRELSEIEELIVLITPSLARVPLARLSTANIAFLASDTGADPVRIGFLHEGAMLAQRSGLPLEAFYAWAREGLPLEWSSLLAVEANELIQALENAIDRKIVPVQLRESLDAIRQSLARLRAADQSAHEPPRTTRNITGQLVDKQTSVALRGLVIHVQDLDAYAVPVAVGQDTTNELGLFAFSLSVPIPANPLDTPGAGRRLHFQVHDFDERVIAEEDAVAPDVADAILVLPISITPPAEKASPDVAVLATSLKLELPASLNEFLATAGIRTLEDVRKVGGLRRLSGRPTDDTSEAASRTIDAHARLAVLGSDAVFNQALIDKGFHDLPRIAEVPRAAFVSAVGNEVGDFQAARAQVGARAQARFLNNVLTGAFADMATGYQPQSEVAAALPPPICRCKDCESAVGPISYVADLCQYAVTQLQDNGPLTLPALESRLLQPFGDLLASCVDAERPVRQVRIAIEVLRRFLAGAPPQGVAEADSGYALRAYQALLSQLGTSYEDMRLARTLEPLERRNLAERVGFDRAAADNEDLDKLLLDRAAVGTPQELTGAHLERLFGLPDTHPDLGRNPLSDGPALGDDLLQIVRWNLDGVEWKANTSPDGLIFVRLVRTAAGAFRLELYRDSDRTELVGTGERQDASGVVAIAESQGSGLEGRIEIRYVQDSDALSLSAVPLITSLRFRHLRTVWAAQDRPPNPYADPPIDPDPDTFQGRLPIIDPDVVGPDDFRLPYASIGATEGPFDLWLKRRAWVDARLAALRAMTKDLTDTQGQVIKDEIGQKKTTPDFDALFAAMYQPVAYGGANVPSAWDATTPVTSFTSLAAHLNDPATSDAARRTIAATLHLSAEGFARLMTFRSKDVRRQPFEEDEQAELVSILVLAQKSKLGDTWLTEESNQKVLLGPEHFWAPTRQPRQGDWPPAPLPSPLLDPDVVKVTDLAEPTVAWRARHIWQVRRTALDDVRAQLQQTVGDDLEHGFDAILKVAFGDPIPVDVNQLSTNLHNSIDVPATLQSISAVLRLKRDEFERLMQLKIKDADRSPQRLPLADAEWSEVFTILTAAYKGRVLVPQWVQVEQATGLVYWNTLRAQLPLWRAPAERRQEWVRALRLRSGPPIVDPDLLVAADNFRHPVVTDPAYALFGERTAWLAQRLGVLTNVRTAAPNALTGLDAAILTGLFTDDVLASLALDSTAADLKRLREDASLDDAMAFAFGSPLPDVDRLFADLSGGNDEATASAQRTITRILRLTIGDFETLVALRQTPPATADPQWSVVDSMMARALLIGSVMGLEEEDQAGSDIAPRLAQLGLAPDAFDYLLRIRRLAAASAPITDGEWGDLEDILLQAIKLRRTARWRDEERQRVLTIGPDAFKLAVADPDMFPRSEPSAGPRWRTMDAAKRNWEDALLARIEQVQATADGMRQAVSVVEQEELPGLRNALILSSSATGTTLPTKAKALTDALLIDMSAGGCQTTTRIAQAIETLQRLIFSVRTGQLKDTYPGLTLISDAFEDEWKWLGSYSTWRAAMFITMYPYNVLIPSLRKRQTPAFRQLVVDLRGTRALTPQQACETANTYAEYFHDVCELTIGASCEALTRAQRVSDCESRAAAADRSLVYMFGRGGVTDEVYWSTYDPKDASPYSQSYWAKVPGFKELSVTAIIGAAPCDVTADGRVIFLFAETNDKGAQKLQFAKYDLLRGRWDGDAADLDPPDRPGKWTAHLKQAVLTTQPPHLFFSYDDGEVWDCRMNARAGNWEGAARLIIDTDTAQVQGQLKAAIEFEPSSFYLFHSHPGYDETFYKLFRLFDRPIYEMEHPALGHWYTRSQAERSEAIRNGASFRRTVGYASDVGAFDTVPVFRGYNDRWTDHIYTRDPSEFSSVPLQLPDSIFHNVEADRYKDEGLLGFIDATQVAGTVPLGRYNEPFKHDHYYTTDLNNPPTGYEGEPGLGFIPDSNWHSLHGAWIGGFSWGVGDGVYAILRESGGATRTVFLSGDAAPEVTGNAVLEGIPSLPSHCGADDESSSRYVVYSGDPLGRQAGAYRSTLRQRAHDLVESDTQRVAPSTLDVAVSVSRDKQGRRLPWESPKPGFGLGVSQYDPYQIVCRLSEAKRKLRYGRIERVFARNELGPRSNLTYIEEAYYFVAVHLALQLQARGEFVAALDWFQTVYDYRLSPEIRKIYPGLRREESLASAFSRLEDWLQDPLNPHAIAETRANTYTRFTLLSLIRCFLDAGDADFARDTAESVPQAREYYRTALELLDSKELKQTLGSCDKLIGEIQIAIGAPPDDLRFVMSKGALAYLNDVSLLAGILAAIRADGMPGQPLGARIDRLTALTAEARASLLPVRTLAAVVEQRPAEIVAAHQALIRDPVIAQAVNRVGDLARNDYSLGFAAVTAISAERLEQGRLSIPALRTPVAEVVGPFGNLPRDVMTAFGPESVPSTPELLVKQPSAALLPALDTVLAYHTYAPVPSFRFCIPPNPVLKALRLHAELNLYKIRRCRNIAGVERQLDPYAAPTDAVSGLPQIGAGGQLVLPGTIAIPPTQYRYQILIERAKQTVQLAAQLEAAMLAAVERRDVESYSMLKAKQDLRLGRASIRLQDLRVTEAQDGVGLAELQRERAQIQLDHYTDLLNEGLSVFEMAAMQLQLAGIIHLHIAAAIKEASSFGIGGIGDVGNALIATASLLQTQASNERRRQEWVFQRSLSAQDVKIGTQQVRLAEDHVRVVGQERTIAAMQADHAEAVVEFLANKMTNVELFDWMSEVLGRAYAALLQRATAIAQLAVNQLAFERQEIAPPIIQADYWNAPTEGIGSDGSSPPDRSGLTGSARLLQDISELDQYAFDTNRRRSVLSQTISLAQLAPAEFQRFRQSGVIRFATPIELFDRRFPGHYLRLIRRVRTAVVALIPPNQGIAAMLSNTGLSRVVIGGDIFQTVRVRRPPETMPISSPRDTGADADPQPDMLQPFEGLGVDTSWEFRMPRAANLIDYDSIADVLVTMEYSALDSFTYRQQVISSLPLTESAERAFSFRHQLADQWYDLNNPDRSDTPLTVKFVTTRSDFPNNLDRLRIDHVMLFFSRSGRPFEVPVARLQLLEAEGDGPAGGAAVSVDGLISTRSGNAGAWAGMLGRSPIGEWQLSLPNTGEMKSRFSNKQITDILFVISYAGRTPAWPA